MVIPKSQHLNPNGLQFPQKRGTLTFLWLIMGTSQLVHGNNNNDAALFLKGMGVGLVLEYSTKSILNVFSFDDFPEWRLVTAHRKAARHQARQAQANKTL